jgi:hypothetical protein
MCIRDVPGMKKKPSTSELLDWLKLLMVEERPNSAPHRNDAMGKQRTSMGQAERPMFVSKARSESAGLSVRGGRRDLKLHEVGILTPFVE